MNVSVASLDECGISLRELPKVVGGQEAPVSAFPWQAAIGYRVRTINTTFYLGTLPGRCSMNYDPIRMTEPETSSTSAAVPSFPAATY